MALALLSIGILSGIFSDLIQPDQDRSMLKVGLNNILLGVVGIGAGYLFINWSALTVVGPVFKFKLIATLLFSILFLLIFANKVAYPDSSGYLGGFLSGLFLSGMLPNIQL